MKRLIFFLCLAATSATADIRLSSGATSAVAIYETTAPVAYALTNTIALVPGTRIYKVAVTGDTTLGFDYTGLDLTRGVARWETWLRLDTTNRVVTLPGTNVVQYLEEPDLSTTKASQTLQITWQAWINGSTTNVQGNLYGRNPAD